MKLNIFLLTICVSLLINPLARAEDGFFLSVGGLNTVKEDGTKIEAEFGLIYSSKDGKDWKQVYKDGPVKENFNHATNNMLRCMTYGNGTFVATGNAKCAVISKDGVNWKIVDAPYGSMSVEFGNGIFFAPNATNAMLSNDGQTWEKVDIPKEFKVWGKDGAGHIRKTVFGNGVFVCVGEQRISVTKDGREWIHHQTLAENERPGRNVLLFGNGRFVWLTENRGPLQSKDGIEWKEIKGFEDLSENAKFGYSGVFDGEKFLVSPASYKDKNKIIYSSKDGLEWKKETEFAQSTNITTAGNGMLLRNQGWAKSFSRSLDNGKTWEEFKVNVPSRKVYFFNSKQIIGQSGG